MKNKNSFSNQRFYWAIYACVIIIALIAGANIYFNLVSFKPKNLDIVKNTEIPKKILTQTNSEVRPVVNTKPEKYLAPEDKKIFRYNSPLKNTKNPDQIKKLDPVQIQDHIKQDTQKKPSDDIQKNQPNPKQISNIKNSARNNIQNNSCFFDETQKMSWPVSGKILMDYNSEKLIYDKTLDQYRTNDSLSIAAKIGDQVKAGADGIVKLITKTDEDGNLIIIDHGNNWTSIYSQLQDNLLVNEGDFVKKGQAIGGVNSPTKYGVLLGSHLDFKVTHNDSSINPKNLLARD